MPELAEVEYYRKLWDPGLGDVITGVQLHGEKRIFRGTDVSALKRRIVGQKLLRSEARGKQMLFTFSGNNSEIIEARESVRSWLGLHLGMSGKLRIEERNFVPEKHDHLVLRQSRRTLVFRDARQFGRVRFQHGPTQPQWWRSDGPEVIARNFNGKFLDHFLRRHARAPIKAVLLLQNGFPGIGNWMADEILWRPRIRPQVPAGKLSDAQRRSLLRETRFVARASLRIIGHDFSDPPRSWLVHQRWKKGGACPRDGTPLKRATIGGRTTAWCPQCQATRGMTSRAKRPNAPRQKGSRKAPERAETKR
ncbi:DNA-formamidopyrimidine glycosylase [soil metagenome]